jgi:acetyltransferase-like isoleucine patch superfamily enzyme
MSSQFWTHGAGVIDRDIQIGRDCYLGSAVRFAPGSGIGNNVIVALGSVVTEKFDISKAMIGGVPAKVLKKNYNWKLEE